MPPNTSSSSSSSSPSSPPPSITSTLASEAGTSASGANNNNNNTAMTKEAPPTTVLIRRLTLSPKDPKRSKKTKLADIRVQLFAGGGAGAISRTLIAPLERVKVLLQVQEVSLDIPKEKRYKGIYDCLTRIPREQGFLAFWRGNGVNVARMIPNSAIKFSTYDTYKSWAFPRGEKSYDNVEMFLRKMACGALSGISTLIPVYPMDLARTRLTADVAQERRYKGLWDVIAKTREAEGVRGLYKGMGISLAGIIPYLAISLSMYDELKKRAKAQNLRFWSTPFGLVCLGSVSAIISQTIAYPLDTVRRHMQVSGALGQKSRYRGTLHCIQYVYGKAGIRGFYRGVLANGLRAAPQTGIEFACYDLIKGFFMRDQDSDHDDDEFNDDDIDLNVVEEQKIRTARARGRDLMMLLTMLPFIPLILVAQLFIVFSSSFALDMSEDLATRDETFALSSSSSSSSAAARVNPIALLLGEGDSTSSTYHLRRSGSSFSRLLKLGRDRIVGYLTVTMGSAAAIVRPLDLAGASWHNA